MNNRANNRAINSAKKALARSQVGEPYAGISSFTWGCSLGRLIDLTISLHAHTHIHTRACARTNTYKCVIFANATCFLPHLVTNSLAISVGRHGSRPPLWPPLPPPCCRRCAKLLWYCRPSLADHSQPHYSLHMSFFLFT